MPADQRFGRESRMPLARLSGVRHRSKVKRRTRWTRNYRSPQDRAFYPKPFSTRPAEPADTARFFVC
jgi:hypothetical protein